MSDSYILTVRSRGPWGIEVLCMTRAELDDAIDRIDGAKRGDHPGYWEFFTPDGRTTRIYGDQIAGFNYEKSA